MTYIVTELQTNREGVTANIVTVYTDRNQAEQKYHSILAAAAASNVYIHAATILDMFGGIIKSEHYRHETAEVEES